MPVAPIPVAFAAAKGFALNPSGPMEANSHVPPHAASRLAERQAD